MAGDKNISQLGAKTNAFHPNDLVILRDFVSNRDVKTTYAQLLAALGSGNGLNAYEVAVLEGFVGTEAEWLESLKGDDAYEIAVANGFVGTVEEWMDSLVGAPGADGDDGADGSDGDNGWSPVFAVVTDGARRVLQVSDWQGGEGTEPATGKYVGVSGLVDAIGDGVDIRGAAGADGADGDDGSNGTNGTNGTDGDNGWSPVFAVVTDGARRVLQVTDWQGGEGTEPATGKYVGASGLVDAIGDGVDIRGAAGAAGGVQSVTGSGVNNTDPDNPVIGYQATQYLNSNECKFDNAYTAGTKSAPRTGNITLNLTGAVRGGSTKMYHQDASAFTIENEVDLVYMFPVADISATDINVLLFVYEIDDADSNAPYVEIYLGLVDNVVAGV